MIPPENDTICALATPPGVGGIGVFRVSGPDAFLVGDKILRQRRPCARHRGYTIHRAHVIHGEEVIDDALVSVFHAPRSYTGEDVVELSCHGGPVVLGRVLSCLLENGARHADPGEFTLRAYLNGKMDLAQAEAVSDIVAAKTEDALRLARAQQAGRLSQAVMAVREQILGILARVEASIDFPEDVGNLDTQTCRRDLDAVRHEFAALSATARRGIFMRDGARVILTGRPNAGKSSLMNALLRSNRALVTAIPGTTRDMIEETLNVHGIPVRLQDTAGLRETDDAVERLGVEKTHETLALADLIVYVVDGTVGVMPGDTAMLISLGDRPKRIVWNKSDLAEALVPPQSTVSVSTVTGQGIEELESEIYAALTAGAGDVREDAPTITQTRHLRAVSDARARVSDAIYTLDAELPADLLSIDLHGALSALGTITGQTAQEDVIAEIFSRFCIGK